MEKQNLGLCYRCESRAKFLEEGHGPRLECSEITQSKYSCYMFNPVKPIPEQSNEGENRAITGCYLSGRSHRSDANIHFTKVIECIDGNIVKFWIPSTTSMIKVRDDYENYSRESLKQLILNNRWKRLLYRIGILKIEY